MLTAASPGTALLGLFKLTLDLKRAKQPVPPTLRDHFNLVLREAKEILREPSALDADTQAEAIELAFLMTSEDEVRDAVAPIDSFEALTGPQADTVLISMEHASDYAHAD